MFCAGDVPPSREGVSGLAREPADGAAADIPVLFVDDDPNFCAAVELTLASTPFP